MKEPARSETLYDPRKFSFLNLFFEKKLRSEVWKIFDWFQFCEGQVAHSKDVFEADLLLKELKKFTEICYSEVQVIGEPWHSFQEIIRRHSIPSLYALDFLRGLHWTALTVPIANQRELIDRAYCVAGTVALMLVSAMGIRSEKARKCVVDLAIAMQLTQIAQDLPLELQKGRCWLPQEWCRDNPSQLLREEGRGELKELRDRLLVLADAYYESGRKSLSILSTRAAWTILVSARIHQETGNQIRHQKAGIGLNAGMSFRKRWGLALKTCMEMFTVTRRLKENGSGASVLTQIWQFQS